MGGFFVTPTDPKENTVINRRCRDLPLNATALLAPQLSFLKRLIQLFESFPYMGPTAKSQ